MKDEILHMLPAAEEAGGRAVYTGPDGILYCGKCHTPVECTKMLFGKARILPCLCSCGQEERRKKEEAAEMRDDLLRIRRLKADGIHERLLRGWRFSSAEETEAVKRARYYVQNWETVRNENLGILFWGDVGTGKTFAAACIANALLEKQVPVLMTSFPKILDQMGSMYSEERQRYIASLGRYPLLVIDDLGCGRSTEYTREQVYAVIDERYKSHLPLIVTTNLTIGEIRDPADSARARIFSRILEMCTPVFVGGQDRRKSRGREKQETVRKLLFPETL